MPCITKALCVQLCLYYSMHVLQQFKQQLHPSRSLGQLHSLQLTELQSFLLCWCMVLGCAVQYGYTWFSCLAQHCTISADRPDIAGRMMLERKEVFAVSIMQQRLHVRADVHRRRARLFRHMWSSYHKNHSCGPDSMIESGPESGL